MLIDADDLLERLERFGRPHPDPAHGPRYRTPGGLLVVDATDDPERLAAHRRLRREAFVDEQGLFAAHDLDDHDADPRTRVLVAVGPDGAVLGGVRLHPAVEGGAGLGWWQGSRLVCAVDAGGLRRGRVGAALVRAACAAALNAGALRFDAHVQPVQERFFARLGWRRLDVIAVAGREHVLMDWPIDRIAALATATKAPLGDLWGDVLQASPAMGAWLGDDGAPVPGTDVVACTDAILPSMVREDPEWAGFCAMLVTAHDLSAMGATPVGALDALAAPDAPAARRVAAGLREGAAKLGLPILGGHTQLGVPAALSVTGLGRTADPVPAGGGRRGDRLVVLADTEGGWRPGYHGRQWDSASHRGAGELRAMLGAVAAARPHAAKDVSMAGIAGTAGMLAEASGGGAELDVAAIPRPDGVDGGDWLTCFPGFAMVCAVDRRGPASPLPPVAPARAAVCGRLTGAPGVRLRWPDGRATEAVAGGVTGLGAIHPNDDDARTPR